MDTPALAAAILELENTMERGEAAPFSPEWVELVRDFTLRLRPQHNRRMSMRIPFEADLHLTTPTGPLSVKATHVSQTGIGLQGKLELLKPQERLAVSSIRYEGTSYAVGAPCQVVWVNASAKKAGLAGLVFLPEQGWREKFHPLYVKIYRHLLARVAAGDIPEERVKKASPANKASPAKSAKASKKAVKGAKKSKAPAAKRRKA